MYEWVYDPHAGGVKISSAVKQRTEQGIPRREWDCNPVSEVLTLPLSLSHARNPDDGRGHIPICANLR